MSVTISRGGAPYSVSLSVKDSIVEVEVEVEAVVVTTMSGLLLTKNLKPG